MKRSLRKNCDSKKLLLEAKKSSTSLSSNSSRSFSPLFPDDGPVASTKLEQSDDKLLATSSSISPSCEVESEFGVLAYHELQIASILRTHHAGFDVGVHPPRDASRDEHTVKAIQKRETLDSRRIPDTNCFRPSDNPSFRSGSIHMELDRNDERLWNHFIQVVLPAIPPILNPSQQFSVASNPAHSILSSNRAYLHCCLMVSAQHLKWHTGSPIETLDNEIMKHRCTIARTLCEDIKDNEKHGDVFEATVGLVYFQSMAGQYDDGLPDVPWHQHFEAAGRLLQNFDLFGTIGGPTKDSMRIPYSLCLYSWIDILGATMKGHRPSLAHLYNEKLLSHRDSSLGLHELMGCDDRVMYLISEIACLDYLKHGGMADVNVRRLVFELDERIMLTDTGGSVDDMGGHSGLSRVQLCNSITNAYRIAARILLRSLSPDFDPRLTESRELIGQLQEALGRLLLGAKGVDNRLNWVYFVGGLASAPDSTLRPFMKDRIAQFGCSNMFGGMRHVIALLHEVWALNDHLWSGGDLGLRFHWRDVMESKGWNFLFM
ncbi:hypothetical protein FSARC_5275 [Fusarium sarcochroum]|uniref:Uncharacterized protein n=1 Tax=Fusarium sarcochroum TaxID=1208366 RepID=A0A8H4XAJ9_9HYPO|nr:hypothetical protein FSARC_5275 [Fusarium sarcochroum]